VRRDGWRTNGDGARDELPLSPRRSADGAYALEEVPWSSSRVPPFLSVPLVPLGTAVAGAAP
jgi:hypothetical protein